MKKRYVWGLFAPDYHDTFYDTEECNVDDIRVKRRGDSPPAFRRLCLHCKEQQDFQEGQRS